MQAVVTQDVGARRAAVGSSRRRPGWERLYAGSLAVVDVLAISAACALALLVRYDGQTPSFVTDPKGDPRDIPYTAFIAVIVPVWLLVLALSRSYEAKILGVGAEEFKRIFNATVRMVSLLALSAVATKAELSRAFLAVAVPSAVVLLVFGRYLGRKVLHAQRRRHRCVHRAVAVGSPEEVEVLARQMLREVEAGLLVVGVALPDYLQQDELVVDDVVLPNLGPARDLVGKLPVVGADTVAVAGTSALSSRELRELSWLLEGTGTDFVVAPALTDVAGPRIHVRPVAGLPLLHIEEPSFGRVSRLTKRLMDLLLAVPLTLLLAPALLAIGLAIRLSDRGPALFRQTRVGRDGTTFRIWKFRSMRVDAEKLLADLKDRNEVTDGPMFKITNDPRVTRLGATLRKYSLDELPQLFNVLGGSMSLVGPRPPLPTEVDDYESHVHRRLLVKPGMTGLWQISGRSDLPWDEVVRLDLYYVENWSLAFDLLILWKTFFAVVLRKGAY